jgi:hypothetical protein
MRIESWTIACFVLSDSMWLSAAVFMINAEPNERLGVKFTFLYFECPIFGKYNILIIGTQWQNVLVGEIFFKL